MAPAETPPSDLRPIALKSTTSPVALQHRIADSTDRRRRFWPPSKIASILALGRCHLPKPALRSDPRAS